MLAPCFSMLIIVVLSLYFTSLWCSIITPFFGVVIPWSASDIAALHAANSDLPTEQVTPANKTNLRSHSFLQPSSSAPKGNKETFVHESSPKSLLERSRTGASRSTEEKAELKPAVLPKPQYDFNQWSDPIRNQICDDSFPGFTCTVNDKNQRVYRFTAGTFKIDRQFLVPENTILQGNSDPNGKLADDFRDIENAQNSFGKLTLQQVENSRPDYSTQTLFLATRGATSNNDRYCKVGDLYNPGKNWRVGLVFSSNTAVLDVSYQGIDTIRPSDNGSLCGGGAFETKGCVQDFCGGDQNTGGSDGRGSKNVVIANVRVNDFYYEEDKNKIGVRIPGNDNVPGGCIYCQPNNVRASQIALWVPMTRDGSASENIVIRNLVVMSLQGDGINFHGKVNNGVVQNAWIMNTGDDIYAVWGAQNPGEKIMFKNTVAYNPGIMRPGWYGQCYATYGLRSVYILNHFCRSPLLDRITVFPWGDKAQQNSVTMIGMHESFDALYPAGGELIVSNYEFTDLDNNIHVDDGSDPSLGKNSVPIKKMIFNSDDKGTRAPYFKWGGNINVKVEFNQDGAIADSKWMNDWMRTTGLVLGERFLPTRTAGGGPNAGAGTGVAGGLPWQQGYVPSSATANTGDTTQIGGGGNANGNGSGQVPAAPGLASTGYYAEKAGPIGCCGGQNRVSYDGSAGQAVSMQPAGNTQAQPLAGGATGR
ncbi:unnamed protein product [Amoebophrya sp. A120]|nr:unnamed protein product [Amoebophrya sp. A120]|eukprot:GSA120T00024959001.1